jgi:hypothetical protein
MTTPPHHTAEHWSQRRRRMDDFIVERVDDHGDSLTLTSTDHSGFALLSKASLGREIAPGEHLRLETVNGSQISGLRDANDWLFHMSNQELADQARKFSEDLHRKHVERLEANRKRYRQWESELPEWLQARIRRFREAGGEHFLLTGWGYELIICQLADLFDRDLHAEAEKLSEEQGASCNQLDCAKLLARGRREMGDEVALVVPAGTSPITGSADYS